MKNKTTNGQHTKPDFTDHFVLDVIIVGAGQAGLSASYFLKKYNLNHIVFERGEVGETWRSQRWNSFRLNSTNKFNLLPGMKTENADEFPSHRSYIKSFEKYISDFDLPVIENAKIIAIEKQQTLPRFKITVLQHDTITYYYCRQVIIASGYQNEPKIPAFASLIPPGIKQLHTGTYREPAQLPEGAVLVVGSAQSGCQVTDDLLDAGRKVCLATSLVGRLPRRYRGRDIFEWLSESGFFDVKKEDVTDPADFLMHPPQLTGYKNGYTISLQSLAKKGAVIIGRMEDANENKGMFSNNARGHVQYADAFSNKVKGFIDGFIAANRISAPPAEEDIADKPDATASCASNITSLDFKEHNITTIIWATGFRGNFNYIKLAVFDENGNPKHKHGISNVDGVYFLGLPWLRSRKSATIYGMVDDAAFIAGKVNEYATEHLPAAVNMQEPVTN